MTTAALTDGRWVRDGLVMRWQPDPKPRRRPTAPGLTCATCHHDLSDGLARVTDRGYVHADLTACTPVRTTPICGTERGYQNHRYEARKGRQTWPLPADDPCGCRAAHRAHEAFRVERSAA